jgi:hypothetical protein
MIPIWVKKDHLRGYVAFTAGVVGFTTSSTGVVNIAITGTAGYNLTVDPGDGTGNEMVALNGGSTPWVHDYAGAPGTKTVVFYGVENISIVDTNNNNTLTFDVGKFNKFSKLNTLNLGYSVITGDASRLNSTVFPVLTSLIVRYCSMSFEPADFGTLAGLINLYCYNNNGSGDLGGFSTLPNLVNFRPYNNAFTYLQTTTWPAYNGVSILLQSTLSTAAEVDRFIIDSVASNWTNNTINFAGTNPARTSASDVALVASILAGNIWTLN